MSSIYRYNYIPFVAIIAALLLCIPLLGFNQQTVKPKIVLSVAAQPVVDPIDEALKAGGLIDLKSLGANFDYDIRYATSNNFTGAPIYQSSRAYLRPQTAQKLTDANKEFNALGYKIKIYDAFRSLSVQKYLYFKVSAKARAQHFIADPYTFGSNHNRGAAVDITIEHLDGTPVAMPTDFDSFLASAAIYYDNLPASVIKSRELLAAVMVKHGFTRCSIEWWHFDDTDAPGYSLIDIAF